MEYANKSLQRMFGYSRNELLAKHIWELDPNVAQAEWPQIWARLTRRESHTFEGVFLIKGGDQIQVEITSTHLSLGDHQFVCSFSRDITERKQAQVALKDSEARLRLITDNLPAFICYVDRDGIYRFANKFYEKAFDRPLDDIIGHPVKDIIGHENYAANLESYRRVLNGEMFTNSVELKSGDEPSKYLLAHYMPDFGPGNAVRGFYVLAQDITELKRGEVALRNSAARYREIFDDAPIALSAGGLK